MQLIKNNLCYKNSRDTQVNHAHSRGMTLIEILVVLVIMGILASLIAPKFLGKTDDAKKVAAKSDVSNIMQSLEIYKLDTGRYPTAEQGLAALISKPELAPVPSNYKDGGYLKKLPKDPWGNDYQYNNPSQHDDDIDVYSFGKDGPTGKKDDYIGSWDQ